MTPSPQRPEASLAKVLAFLVAVLIFLSSERFFSGFRKLLIFSTELNESAENAELGLITV